ncbi:MAG: phosphatase PAP2 family protein [Sphingomonas sp.]
MDIRTRIPGLPLAQAPLLIAALAAGAFLLLAWLTSGGATGFDHWLLLALRQAGDPSVPIGPAWMHQAMVLLTSLGATQVLIAATLAAALYLAVTRRAAAAGLLVAAVASGLLVHTLLKKLFDRARPDIVDHLVGTHSTSFPSGHAFNSAMVYLLLAFVLTQSGRLAPVRLRVTAATAAFVLLIGFSRVYLGVHWPSDVLAGWCGGIFWAAAWSLALRGRAAG